MPGAIGRDQRGAAYVEFLLAFLPILTLFLGLVQLGLLYAGNLVVQHAAHRAVRTAVVVLDDDPRHYDGEPRLVIDGPQATAADLEWLLARGEGAPAGSRPAVPSRRASIELAAMVLLSSVEPGEGDSVADALAVLERSRRADRVRASTTVELDVQRPPRGSTEPPVVRVRLRAGFACRVPVVRRLVCDGGRRVIEAEDSGAVHQGDYLYGEGDWGAP